MTKIIYRAPYAVFNDRIVFMPIEIKGDKHVKIMFDRINSTPQLKVAECRPSRPSNLTMARTRSSTIGTRSVNSSW